MRKGKQYDLSSVRFEEIKAASKSKHKMTQPVAYNAAAESTRGKAKDLDAVQSADRSAPPADETGRPQKEGTAFGPLLWMLLPLLAVIIWQILSGG